MATHAESSFAGLRRLPYRVDIALTEQARTLFPRQPVLVVRMHSGVWMLAVEACPSVPLGSVFDEAWDALLLAAQPMSLPDAPPSARVDIVTIGGALSIIARPFGFPAGETRAGGRCHCGGSAPSSA